MRAILSRAGVVKLSTQNVDKPMDKYLTTEFNDAGSMGCKGRHQNDQGEAV